MQGIGKEQVIRASEIFNQAEYLMNSGKYNEALSILTDLEEIRDLNAKDQLRSHHLQGSILYKVRNEDL